MLHGKFGMTNSFWENKKVLITGHSGFKGGWLAQILFQKDAIVTGISLEPISSPNFFYELEINKKTKSYISDINDYEVLDKIFKKEKPEIIFHLAAESLVLNSYKNPINTFKTNIIGTANVLELSKKYSDFIKSVVIVTTDKCYRNLEKGNFFVEDDPLGGIDPYSASKACAEILTDCYLNSYFQKLPTNIASARAGNVIGGGDWAFNRLIPDIINSIFDNKELIIRYPNAVRPWQHVLEPIFGYLKLAENLFYDQKFCQAWNFGPSEKNNNLSVIQIIEYIENKLNRELKYSIKKEAEHEAGMLNLNSTKAKEMLNWIPKFCIEEALDLTINWYKNFYVSRQNLESLTLDQIKLYENLEVLS